jgi:hypothetical protein
MHGVGEWGAYLKGSTCVEIDSKSVTSTSEDHALKHRGATVGTEMNGRDRATWVGQLVIAEQMNRERGSGWTGF